MKNLKRSVLGLSFFIVLLCLQGCGENTGGRSQVENYRCTSEQLDLVKKEFEICIESSYLTSYCFLQAKKTQCDKILKPKET